MHFKREFSGDQYFQYKLGLDTTGATTAVVDNIVVVYVVNAPPAFESAPTATQGTDGIVDISYSILDSDGSTGSVTTGFVTPTFEYYNGSTWTSIASSSISYGAAPESGEVTDDNGDGYIDNKVLDGSYLTYTATWIASTTIADLYTEAFQIRVTINDNEGANNTVASSSVAAILDTTAPTSPSLVVDASTVPATLTLSATDDSAL